MDPTFKNSFMKQTITVLVSLLFIGLSLTQAQIDTVDNKNSNGDTLRLAPVTPPQPTTPARQQQQYHQDDRVLVLPEQMPIHLRESLQGSQYKGWENSPIYQDRITGEYSLDINDGATSRSYRFDKNGKLIADPNKPKEKTER